MAQIQCVNCQGKKRTNPITVECGPTAIFEGIVTCLACGHEIPVTIQDSYLKKLDVALPGMQSDKLHPSVTEDITEDIKEAERANYSQCLKACVTMCRRALQLGLIDREIDEMPLGRMLKIAFDKKLLTQDTYFLSTSIKGFGDIGAHRREKLEPEEVKLVIYATVRMLNELFT